jgi:hypothetical protein
MKRARMERVRVETVENRERKNGDSLKMKRVSMERQLIIEKMRIETAETRESLSGDS